MKNIITLLCIALFHSSLFSQFYEVKFEVEYKSKFSSFALQKFKEDAIQDRSNDQQEFIKKTENPKPSYYLVKFNNKVSITSYQASLNNNQDANLEVNIKPFGSGEVFKFSNTDSIKSFTHHQNLEKNIFSEKDLLSLDWIDAKKDSTILSYKVSLVKSETPEAYFAVWYTKDLPMGIGISDLKFNKGFILGLEIKKKSSPVFDFEEIKAYPLHIKRNKKDLKINNLSVNNWKIYKEDKIKEMYSRLNENSQF